jgi:hypothetical protein
MEPFATVDELKARLDWDLEADEERTAAGALEDLSEWVRYYGRNWTKANAPRLVRSIVLSAAARFMRNPDGYVQSRAGDETLAWTDRGEDAGSASLTREEIESVKRLARPIAFGTLHVSAWGPQRRSTVGYVPTDSTPFPYYSGSGPW